MTRRKILFLFFSLLIAGAVVSQINFIPTWENVEGIFVVTTFAIGVSTGLFYLIKLWKNNYRNREKLKARSWLTSTLISVAMIGLITILFLFSGLSVGQGFLGPSFVEAYEFKNATIYQYQQSCFPPDNECECPDYYSLIYLKNPYFPTMHLKKKVDFYVESIKLVDDDLIIRASGACEKDSDKETAVGLK